MSWLEPKSAWIKPAAVDTGPVPDLPSLAAPVLPPRSAIRAATTSDLRPVLIVLHQETSTPGRVGNALRLLGYPLDVRRPRFGDPLPETMAEHSAAIIFGGPMSANDQDEFIRRETEWIGVPLKESKPFLGICLG